MGRRFGTGRWVMTAALGCVAALAPVAVVTSAVAADNIITTTESTKRVTTTTRVDLEAAPAEVCDAPATEPVLIDQTSQELVPTITSTLVIGPGTIMIGENQQTPFFVPNGTSNVDTLITYTTVVTQYFQATAPGPPCAVVVAARFTG